MYMSPTLRIAITARINAIYKQIIIKPFQVIHYSFTGHVNKHTREVQIKPTLIAVVQTTVEPL